MSRRPRLPVKLFWRVYLNGLLLLILVALAVAAVATALGREPAGRSPEKFAAYAAARVGELRADPAALQRELVRLQEAFGARLTVFEGGVPAASSDEEALAPLAAEHQPRLAQGAFKVPGRRFTLAAPVPGSPPAYLVLVGHVPQHSFLRGASFLAAVLLALALASIPLARAIAAPLERLGRAVRAFGGGDLTARARLSTRGEVGEVASAFDQMADRIQLLVRSEKELLANVSHELRTPLARIRVALEMAEEGDLERSRRYLAEIGTDLEELSRLVDDVLTAARLELAQDRGAAAELPLRRERLEARELVLRAVERFEAAHPGRALALALQDGLPDVDADPALLRRVLDNLLDNARKYSDPGSPIALAARGRADELEIEVRDRGIGIDPADLPRLFTPFFRSDRSRAR
ncbi:MAG TPA: HAMP domain-containing sensor histidine kinase, partial [Anaeromyxobacteraceae bacterium]